MLNLWRLRLLQELAALGTMTAVADAMLITRAAVSQHLSQLETEIGAVLVERDGRRVRLTEAGLRLVAHSNELFQMIEEIEADVAAAKKSVSGDIRLAAFGTFSASIAPVVVSALLAEHPQLSLSFTELEPTEALRAVHAKQVDIAVVDNLVPSQAQTSALEFFPLGTDYFYAAVADTHPHAGKAAIHLNDLAENQWAINESAVAYHGYVLNACWEAGFSPKIVASCKNTLATLEFVRRGWAVAVLPGLATTQCPPGVAMRKVEPPLQRSLFAAIVAGSSRRPATAAALTALTDHTAAWITAQR
ncbi:LysR family transcriptional regulator [Mycobacterium sp. 236(2023)]|uniref:LysR family transcriptional regulator n=1 Tax=Mycobacterium sp. 236(2023) TaxID=3038163 RepID=UPI0024155057|nr:LysR family transcriptional regulator [Mycobacterium sp. 236(2023)]MDG4669345.1 LysR family transcriptional regulator [Mycobacterium sp. 236(2023)]